MEKLSQKRIGEIALMLVKSENEWKPCCRKHNEDFITKLNEEAEALGVSINDAVQFVAYLTSKKHAKTMSLILGAEEVPVLVTPEMEEIFGEIALKSIKQKLMRKGVRIYFSEIKNQILASSAMLEIEPLEATLFAKEIVDFAYCMTLGQIDDLIMDLLEKTPKA